MKNSVISFAIAISLIGCNKKEEIKAGESPIKTETDTIVSSSETEKNCYEFVQQKDTISLSYNQTGNKVNGELHFKNFEKDSSHGKVEGIFSGDTLKLDYTFQSEGTESVREMNFLKNGLSLIMGTGDMEDKDGKMSFKNQKHIKYIDAIVLVKADCKN
ncbi:hypothetical protein [Flavobacterium silvaticum]|uniref:Uncharacterized protein n=1 Tax=Flavobacterium silvaticum TaxID=1852020 RepID=A0A972FSL2_9FLAO|nr:hypothetical protein [Flavobacterium silvaticum]NMH26780.1 hypothetical protein [Flavobacterium silvaticum]